MDDEHQTITKNGAPHWNVCLRFNFKIGLFSVQSQGFDEQQGEMMVEGGVEMFRQILSQPERDSVCLSRSHQGKQTDWSQIGENESSCCFKKYGRPPIYVPHGHNVPNR